MTTATATSSFEELCHEVGNELVDQRQQRTQAYHQQPLNTPPQAASPPVPLAVVLIDEGRIQTRQADAGPGVHNPAWRETKTAVLLRKKHQPADSNPQPELPECFAVAGGSSPAPTPAPAPTAMSADSLLSLTVPR